MQSGLVKRNQKEEDKCNQLHSQFSISGQIGKQNEGASIEADFISKLLSKMVTSDWMFSWLFKPRQKDPLEMLELLINSMHTLQSNSAHGLEKSRKSASKALHHLKLFLTQTTEGDASDLGRHEMLAIWTNEALNVGILTLLSGSLSLLDFETRKDAVSVFTCLIHRRVGNRYPAVDSLLTRGEAVLEHLIKGQTQEGAELALLYGKMLREAATFELLVERLLESDSALMLFDIAKLPTFDVASDAVASIKVEEVLTIRICCLISHISP